MSEPFVEKRYDCPYPNFWPAQSKDCCKECQANIEWANLNDIEWQRPLVASWAEPGGEIVLGKIHVVDVIEGNLKKVEQPESEVRKNTPVTTGVLDYFPDAIKAVARLSKFGNDKHNPGQPLHWAREKSTDHADCVGRHLIDRATLDPDSRMSHTVALAWRALALLQVEIEKDRDNASSK